MVYQCWYALDNMLTQITIDQITDQRDLFLHCSHLTFPIQMLAMVWFSGHKIRFPIVASNDLRKCPAQYRPPLARVCLNLFGKRIDGTKLSFDLKPSRKRPCNYRKHLMGAFFSMLLNLRWIIDFIQKEYLCKKTRKSMKIKWLLHQLFYSMPFSMAFTAH